jgi:WD40 repeat protein
VALFSSLNSKVSLFNIRTGKLLREYHGHSNNEYLIDLILSTNPQGDLDGFYTGSENGQIHRFDLLQETPVASFAASPEGQTVDLLLQTGQSLVVSGRAWQSVIKIDCLSEN